VRARLALVAVVLSAPACFQAGYTQAQAPAPDAGGEPTSLQVVPDASVLPPHGGQTFAASGVSVVTWSITEGADGGVVTDAGLYTAPAGTGAFHVVATDIANPAVFGQAVVNVATVTITPQPATVDTCSTLQFTATVAGLSPTTVTWSVSEGATGGTISASGLYTAPSTSGTYHVVATSTAASNITRTATVTVTDHVLSVVVSPASVTLPPGGSQQFSVTVTTSCGASTFSKIVTAQGSGH
jgi:hypothetical protein